MLKIDMMSNISDTKKRLLKVGVTKTQIQIRRKVLCQSVPITFTSNRKQRPFTDIIRELHDVIVHSDLSVEFVFFLERPMTLIGKRIKQRFQDESNNPDNCTWYEGTVTGYRASDKAHCVEYDEEEEVYYFDLTLIFLTVTLL